MFLSKRFIYIKKTLDYYIKNAFSEQMHKKENKNNFICTLLYIFSWSAWTACCCI